MILVPNSESTEISLEIVNSILKILVAEHYLVMHSLLTRVFVIIPHQHNYRDKVQQAIPCTGGVYKLVLRVRNTKSPEV